MMRVIVFFRDTLIWVALLSPTLFTAQMLSKISPEKK